MSVSALQIEHPPVTVENAEEVITATATVLRDLMVSHPDVRIHPFLASGLIDQLTVSTQVLAGIEPGSLTYGPISSNSEPEVAYLRVYSGGDLTRRRDLEALLPFNQGKSEPEEEK